MILKKNIIKAISLLLGVLIALYVTGLRIFTFIFEMGFKTEETNTIRNLIFFNIPDFISVVFCIVILLHLIKKAAKLIRD